MIDPKILQGFEIKDWFVIAWFFYWSIFGKLCGLEIDYINGYE